MKNKSNINKKNKLMIQGRGQEVQINKINKNHK